MNDFIFFLSEAFINVRRSGMMMLISIMTAVVSLLVMGVFMLLLANLNNLANFLSSKLEIRIYLRDNVAPKDIILFRDKLSDTEGIKEVVFIDRHSAWTTFKKSFRKLQLDELVDVNPLPNSFKIYLTKNNNITQIANELKQNYPEYIEDVAFTTTIAEKIEKLSRFAKISGLILVGFLSIATLFIVVNTIQLTVLARHDEIEIMQLVGAADRFIKWPFIIEGLFIGVMAGIISIIILKFFYYFISVKFHASLPFLPLVFDAFILNGIYTLIFLAGPAVGGLGAYISVSRSLKA